MLRSGAPRMADDIFTLLQPLLISISAKAHSSAPEDIDEFSRLQGVISNTPKPSLLLGLDIVLLPLVILLKNPKVNYMKKEKSMKVLQTLLQAISLQTEQQFLQIFYALSELLHQTATHAPSSERVFNKVPEELKLELAQTLSALLLSYLPLSSSSLASEPSLPSTSLGVASNSDEIAKKGRTKGLGEFCSAASMGWWVTAMLDYASKEKNRDLKLSSIEAVRLILERLEPQFVAFFLPGVVSSLSKVTTGDFKQGQQIIAASLEVLSFAICKALCVPTPLLTSREEDKTFVVDVNSKQWVEETSAALNRLIPKTHTLLLPFEPKPLMRSVQVRASGSLLLQATKLLSTKTRAFLFDVLIFHNDDDDLEIRKVANDFLQQLRSTSINTSSSTSSAQSLSTAISSSSFADVDLETQLKDSFRQKLRSLPRHIRSVTSDDLTKRTALRLVLNYLRQLHAQCGANSLSSLLHLSIDDIAVTLFHVFALDPADNRIVEPSISSKGSTEYPKKMFKHFRDDQIASTAYEICRLLSRLGDVALLLDHFVQALSVTAPYRKESLVILSQFVIGAGVSLDDTIKRGLLQELETLLSAADTEENDPMEICLILELIGNVISNSSEEFLAVSVLPTLLYYLLLYVQDKAALSFASTYALVTLNRLATALRLSSPSAIVAQNSDYLFDQTSSRLRNLPLYPQTPRVLLAIFQNLSEGLEVSLIEDTLEQVLQSLDSFNRNTELIRPLLTVLVSIVRALGKRIPPLPPEPPSSIPEPLPEPKFEEEKEEKKTPEEIREFFLKLHRDKENAMPESDYDNAAELERREEETRIKASKEELTVYRCMEKMQHFISGATPALALVALEVVREGVSVVHGKAPNGLLPLVHSLWSPILMRCSRSNDAPEVVITALQLIGVMTVKTGDFLLGKFSELWPIISKHLMQLSRSNAQFASQTAYEFLPAFKQQIAALETLTLLVKAEAQDPHRTVLPLEDIVRVCGMYLQSSQVEPMQQAARRLFTAIIEDNPDAVRLQLMRWSHTPPPPPPPGSAPVRITFDPSTAFMFNARLLLGVLNNQDRKRNEEKSGLEQ